MWRGGGGGGGGGETERERRSRKAYLSDLPKFHQSGVFLGVWPLLSV